MGGGDGGDPGDQRQGPGQANGLAGAAPEGAAPRERLTVRLVLLSPADRLLLLKFDTSRFTAWCTTGGGVDDGESLIEAARRELWEETGHVDADFGPVVWRRQHDLVLDGEPRRMSEHYFLVRARNETLSDANWTEDERRVVKAMRWWSLDEIAASQEAIFPGDLYRHLPPLLKGDIPSAPLWVGD
jgi:8-oxo-dGTP pyrophosphatase MutT (NUDIX family)